jgi:hypothetical protein
MEIHFEFTRVCVSVVTDVAPAVADRQYPSYASSGPTFGSVGGS